MRLGLLYERSSDGSCHVSKASLDPFDLIAERPSLEVHEAGHNPHTSYPLTRGDFMTYFELDAGQVRENAKIYVPEFRWVSADRVFHSLAEAWTFWKESGAREDEPFGATEDGPMWIDDYKDPVIGLLVYKVRWTPEAKRFELSGPKKIRRQTLCFACGYTLSALSDGKKLIQAPDQSDDKWTEFCGLVRRCELEDRKLEERNCLLRQKEIHQLQEEAERQALVDVIARWPLDRLTQVVKNTA